MEESAAARKFFMARLTKWSAWVIPGAFLLGMAGRIWKQDGEQNNLKAKTMDHIRADVDAEAKRIFAERHGNNSKP